MPSLVLLFVLTVEIFTCSRVSGHEQTQGGYSSTLYCLQTAGSFDSVHLAAVLVKGAE